MTDLLLVTAASYSVSVKVVPVDSRPTEGGSIDRNSIPRETSHILLTDESLRVTGLLTWETWCTSHRPQTDLNHIYNFQSRFYSGTGWSDQPDLGQCRIRSCWWRQWARSTNHPGRNCRSPHWCPSSRQRLRPRWTSSTHYCHSLAEQSALWRGQTPPPITHLSIVLCVRGYFC